MFFNKKKQQKLDPKVRFQNRQFNQKLQQARTFKRTIKSVPDSSADKMLAKVGLGNRLSQIVLGILVLGILYLVYAPNFLTIDELSVEGLSQSDAALVEASVRDSIGNVPFYNPQRNLFFLSNARVREAVMNIPSINKVDKIVRDYKNKSLKIIVEAKYERFLVRTKDKVFDVYNDGSIKGISGIDLNSWPTTQNPNMSKIDIPANVLQNDKKEFISPQTTEYIKDLQEQLKGLTGSSLAYFSLVPQEIKPNQSELPTIEEQIAELEKEKLGEESNESEADEKPIEQEPKPVQIEDIELPLNLQELNIIMQKNSDPKRTFRVLVDTKENPKELVLRLSLLLSQTAPDRYNNLSYIDMRIQSRAFICLQNTVCDK